MSTDNIEKMVDDLVCHWYEDKFNNPYRDAIIARLRAADALCEAAKQTITMDRSIFERLFGGKVADSARTIHDLEKRISDYERGQ